MESNDERLARIYKEGFNKSHADGLKAVYEAGQKHDEYVIDQRAAAEDERVATRQSVINDESRAKEEARIAEERLTPEERKLADEKKALEDERTAAKSRLAEERQKTADTLAKEAAEREQARVKALDGNTEPKGKRKVEDAPLRQPFA